MKSLKPLSLAIVMLISYVTFEQDTAKMKFDRDLKNGNVYPPEQVHL